MTTVILTLLFFLLCPGQAADATPPAADRFYEQGTADLARGKIPAAVRSFVRSLLLRPDHAGARAFLKQLSRDTRQLDLFQCQQIERFLGLIDYLRFIQGHIGRTYAENIEIAEHIREHAPDIDLEQPPTGLGPLSALNDLYEIQAAFPGEWTGSSFRLTEINGRLSHLKNDRVALLKKIQAINTQLWELKQESIRDSARTRQAHLTTAYTNKIQHLEQRMLLQQQQIQRQEKVIRTLTDQYQSTHRDYEGLQRRFLKISRHANSLTKQLADMSLGLFERDRDLADQVHHNELLKEELLDHKQRASLTSRIMHEKDQRIKDLAARLPERTGSVDKTGPGAGKPPQADRLQAMEREIQHLRRHYELAASNLKKQDRHIQTLKEKLSVRDRTIAEMQQAFLSQERKLYEMAGMLEIYRLKLAGKATPPSTSGTLTRTAHSPSRMRRQFVDRHRLTDPVTSVPSAPISIIDPRLPFGHSRDVIYHKTTERIQHLIPPGSRSGWQRP